MEQIVLHSEELDRILWRYTNDEYDSSEIAEFARYDVPLLIQQIEILYNMLWDLREQITK